MLVHKDDKDKDLVKLVIMTSGCTTMIFPRSNK